MRRVIDPMSINWKQVAAGQVHVAAAAEARAGELDGTDEVHVPKQAGHLAARHAGEGEDRGGRPAAEQRLRPPRGCAAVRALAVQRPSAEGSRVPRPEQKVPLPTLVPIYITYLTAVPSGTVDHLFRRLLRSRPCRGARQDRKPLTGLALADVPGPKHRDVVRFSRFGASRARSNGSVNWTPNLPACAQRTVP